MTQNTTFDILHKMNRLLSIDYGTKKIGIAITDPLKLIVSPYTTIDNKSIISSIKCILEICKTLSVERIVLGLPLNYEGFETEKSEEVRNFHQRLVLETTIPIDLWDERNTTVEANEFLKLKKMNWKDSKKVIDQIAAAIILQCYIDSRG